MIRFGFSLRVTVLLAFAILMTVSMPADAGEPVSQTTTMHTFPDGVPIPDTSATLTSFRHRARVEIKTVDEPLSTYTIWVIVFNNPENCVTNPDGEVKCGLADLGPDSPAGNSIFWDGGGISDANGNLMLVSNIREGEIPDGEGQYFWGDGLLDSMNSEIHVILRTHGPRARGLVYAQTHSFNGGCSVEPDDGLFACADIQAAGFPAAASVVAAAPPANRPVSKLAVSWGRIKKDAK